ncbi:ALOX15 [Symbiodinium sp. CCMP2592]|nr:ALOX15 [Symbiodinium sp. CCMP2592]
MEKVPLLPAGESSVAPSWPVVQPPEPAYSTLNDCQTCLRCPSAYGCGCCSALCYATLGLVVFALFLVLYPFVAALALVLLLLFGWLAGYLVVYLACLRPPPALVWKGAKLLQLTRLTFYQLPKAAEWRVTDLKPKAKLTTGLLQYAIAVRVPFLSEGELYAGGLFESLARLAPSAEFMTSSMFFSAPPAISSLSSFREGENPVEYVMEVCRDIYPKVVQEWKDKTSDRALAHFCLHGLGAHRLEKADPSLHPGCVYAVRTNQLAALPVRDGFEHYGNDVYFDKDFKVLKIVREEQVEPWEMPKSTTFLPDGSRTWEYAKFCFRSSLFSFVTLVDHLYGCHLQLANVVVQAMREQLSSDHPIRRFLLPFSYGTININDLARQTLVTRDSFVPQLLPLDNEGLQLAWASAYKLLPPEYVLDTASGSEGPVELMETLFDREKVIKRKQEQGLATSYYQQALRYWRILRKFVADYLDHYYGTGSRGEMALAADEELKLFLLQTVTQLQAFSDPFSTGQMHELWPSVPNSRKKPIFINFLTRFCELVTVGHEQVGQVQAYAQDASFCTFSWSKSLRQEGPLVGPKEVALGGALLMALTSTPMPRLLAQSPADDWSHVFPAMSEGDRAKIFGDFQAELRKFSAECDEYNATAAERPFPNDFGLWVFNPKFLETSVSI